MDPGRYLSIEILEKRSGIRLVATLPTSVILALLVVCAIGVWKGFNEYESYLLSRDAKVSETAISNAVKDYPIALKASRDNAALLHLAETKLATTTDALRSAERQATELAERRRAAEARTAELTNQVARVEGELKSAQADLMNERKRRAALVERDRAQVRDELASLSRSESQQELAALRSRIAELEAARPPSETQGQVTLAHASNQKLWLTTRQLLRRPDGKLIEVRSVTDGKLHLHSDGLSKYLSIADEATFYLGNTFPPKKCEIRLVQVDQSMRALVEANCDA